MHLTDAEKCYFDDHVQRLLDITQFACMKSYTQHGKTSCLTHSIAVAYVSYWLCKRLHLTISYNSLIRGALLHDFFLYDWHEKDASHKWHGFFHPQRALANAEKFFTLDGVERQIIVTHMWPLTLRALPRHQAAIIVCLADKFCSIIETCRLQDHFTIYHYAKRKEAR